MSEDYSRNQSTGNNYSGRKPSVHKYGDNKGRNYSPSASYNYQNTQGRGQGYQQHPRRRIDRFKRENMNFSDKLVKQNDIIIRLLKEIRDSLAGTPQPATKIEGSDMVEQKNTSVSVETTEEEPTEAAVSSEAEKEPESDTEEPAVSDEKEPQPEDSGPEEKASDVVDK